MKLLAILIVLMLAWITYRVILGEATTDILARRLGPLICRLAGHRRRGDAVRKVEGVYYSRCRRCGARLHKVGRDADWQTSNALQIEEEPAAH